MRVFLITLVLSKKRIKLSFLLIGKSLKTLGQTVKWANKTRDSGKEKLLGNHVGTIFNVDVVRDRTFKLIRYRFKNLYKSDHKKILIFYATGYWNFIFIVDSTQLIKSGVVYIISDLTIVFLVQKDWISTVYGDNMFTLTRSD